MPELSYRRRMLVLIICAMSLLIVGLDVTIVNVALPSIQRDLHAQVSGLQWIIAAYTLVIASLLMLSGSTGDRLGRRRTFQVGLVIFTVGSLLCSVAPSLGWLIGFRMLQAVGGSMLNPVAMSIITNVFTDPRERARAIGVWGAVFGLSMALGPVLGGLLVDTAGWRSIFWINIPIGIAVIIATQLFVPESKAAHVRRVDPIGQLLVIVTLASLTYAIIEGPSRGWSSTEIIGFFVLSVLAAAGLGWYETRRDEPLIDFRFFRSVPFAGATVIAVCAFATMGAFLFLGVLYLQDVRGLDALHSGLWLLPAAAMTLLFAPLSGRIVGSRGPRIPLLIAGAAITAGAIMATRLTAATPALYVLGAFLVFGIGNAMVNAPITNTAVSGMPRAQAGVAAAIASTSRQTGSSLGVALTGSIVASYTGRGAFGTGFTDASHIAWWVVAGFGAAVLVLGAVTSGRWARRTAQRTASLLDPVPGVQAPTEAGVR
jgi:EmrB/QacA subfamily drug resistance transporter